MGKKIFGIYLAKLDAPNSEAHARLELPASPLELHDAMDKVQLQENEELYRFFRRHPGEGTPMILAIVLVLLILFCTVAEFSRVWIIAQGVKEAAQQAVISTINDNYPGSMRNGESRSEATSAACGRKTIRFSLTSMT